MSFARAYGFALLAFLIAALLRLGIDPWLGKSVPYLMFFPAIMVAARYGGFGPGVLVVLAALAVTVLRFSRPSLVTMRLRAGGSLSRIVTYRALTVGWVCRHGERLFAIASTGGAERAEAPTPDMRCEPPLFRERQCRWHIERAKWSIRGTAVQNRDGGSGTWINRGDELVSGQPRQLLDGGGRNLPRERLAQIRIRIHA